MFIKQSPPDQGQVQRFTQREASENYGTGFPIQVEHAHDASGSPVRHAPEPAGPLATG